MWCLPERVPGLSQRRRTFLWWRLCRADRSGPDTRADWQQVDTRKIRIAQGAQFFFTHERTAGVNPGDQAMLSRWRYSHSIVLTAAGQLDLDPTRENSQNGLIKIWSRGVLFTDSL